MRATQVQVSISTYPDLQVTAVNAPDSGVSGQVVTVVWTIANKGTAATPSNVWYDTVYLSKDQILDVTDCKLGAFQRQNALGKNVSYTQSVQVSIPSGASGPYYVFVVTDSTNAIFEHTAEDNNTGYDSGALVVSIVPPSDLVVPSVNAPASGTPGQPATITWTVTNQSANPASGQWTDSVYISSDSTWDINDQLVGYKDHSGGLSPSASYNGNLSATLPAVTPGTYYIIVRTDIRNAVR